MELRFSHLSGSRWSTAISELGVLIDYGEWSPLSLMCHRGCALFSMVKQAAESLLPRRLVSGSDMPAVIVSLAWCMARESKACSLKVCHLWHLGYCPLPFFIFGFSSKWTACRTL